MKFESIRDQRYILWHGFVGDLYRYDLLKPKVDLDLLVCIAFNFNRLSIAPILDDAKRCFYEKYEDKH